jgi:flagellar biosynthetic protein FlhB
MAEEQQGQEKTEDATPRKLEKAKEEGQVARSRELNSVAIVTFGAIAAMFIAPNLANSMMDLARTVFSSAAQTQIPMPTFLGNAIMDALWALLPFSVVMFFAGLLSSLGVGGLMFSTKALQPKASRMSPIKGFGRMFSVKSLVELAKSIAKIVLIAGVATLVLSAFMNDLLVLGGLPIEVAASEGVTYVGWALLFIGFALVLVAAIDVPFQMAQHKKQLKMTKQEVKDELKDSEGKPEVKAKLRALQQQVSRRKMLEEVANADVVITNPEHFSVAIRYESKNMVAPVLVAKGLDHMAFRIREVADHHEVPMVPVPALARAIYYSTEAGEEVPAGLYIAVAQVLAYIYQLEQYKRGQTPAVPVLDNIDVPEEFTVEGFDE